MKSLAFAIGLAVLAPSLAWGHAGGVDKHGCHTDNQKGDYHCHKGKLEGRTFKNQDTMLQAHPELRSGAPAEDRKARLERAKKEKAEDKLKDGDKTTTEEYAKDAKKKTSTPSR
jgi:hypothetical protein